MSDPEEEVPPTSSEIVQNAEDSSRPIDLGILPTNSAKSLKYQAATISLAPYQMEAQAFDRPVVLQDDTKKGGAFTEIATEYKGRKAENITFEILQPIRLPANSEYAFPINYVEEGELVHFTVSVNDQNIVTTCSLYDDNNRPVSICKHSTRELTILGRGLTLGEAEATDQNGISLDRGGRKHDVMPYAARYKHTFDLGFRDPADYGTVEGTEADKFFVIDYAPTIPRAYNRIYFNIQNKANVTKLIHYVVLQRYAYRDKYDYVVREKDEETAKATLTV